MTRAAPPARCPGTPHEEVLAAGTKLYRLHSASFGPIAFNPTRSNDPLRGGRFDSHDGSYAYLYAGSSYAIAIAETLARDIPPGPVPPRLVPRAHVVARKLSKIEVRADLRLVRLHGGPALGQVGQDSWLTKSPASDYELTRPWASAIRAWTPWAQGFVWRSNRDERGFAYILFGDRVPARSLSGTVELAADSGNGLLLVRSVLMDHNIVMT
ncbi:MAG TPA: RES family NAD+ phosphorylase [Kofleriaceae bacterium]|jgi:hypothetical protein